MGNQHAHCIPSAGIAECFLHIKNIINYIFGAKLLHMCAYIQTHRHTYIHTYTHTHTHTCVHMYIHTYIHTYVVHTYTHTHAHSFIHSFISWIDKCVTSCKYPNIHNSYSAKYYKYFTKQNYISFLHTQNSSTE
jgi:hypothetical protein